MAEKLQAVNERFADAQAENLNVEVDYPSLKPNSKLQAQYRKTTRSFSALIALLKAA